MTHPHVRWSKQRPVRGRAAPLAGALCGALAALVGLVGPAGAAPPAAPGAQPAPAATPARENPLLTPSPLPFQTPPFDRIRDADLQPALEEGMRQQLAEVRQIAADPAAPTFENTFVALEKSGRLLERAYLVFNALASAHTNPTLQQLREELAPKLAAHADAIHLDAPLFARIQAVHAQRAGLGLDAESLRLVEFVHDQFVMAGANLSAADKATLAKINAEDAGLAARFENQLLGGMKAGGLVIADVQELAGLPQAAIDAAAEAAKERGLAGRWLLPLQNTTQQPALASLTTRSVRERLFKASWERTEQGDAYDTRAIVSRLAELRAQKAKLLGHASYAAWKLQDQMARTPAAVQQFLGRLVPPAVASARREAAAIQALIDAQQGGFALEPWDWDFYAEQVRKARYDVDEAQLRPYFQLERVLHDGVFYAAHELYGLTFKERRDLPVYHPDVRVFDVIDAGGKPLALYYYDPYQRDSKLGGAWMDVFVNQSKLHGTRPVVTNVTNFTKPAPGEPALLSWDDVTTLFHEFGHTLHGMFADQQYPSLSGTAVARDFVELPSQINEHWALHPQVLAHYAVDRKGRRMPAELAEKLRRTKTFNQGYALTELLAAAELDMRWHTLAPDAAPQKVDAFQAQALEAAGLALREVPPRYRSSYFLHIWSNSYSAGYYAYLWAEMLDTDAFAWFEENGGLTRKNGDRFRALILSRGNTADLATLFREFRGRDPQIEPMLRHRGLLDPVAPNP